MTPEERDRLGLATPGAGSGSAGIEQRLELLHDQLAGLRQDLAALLAQRQPAEPAPEPAEGATRLREPKPPARGRKKAGDP